MSAPVFRHTSGSTAPRPFDADAWGYSMTFTPKQRRDRVQKVGLARAAVWAAIMAAIFAVAVNLFHGGL